MIRDELDLFWEIQRFGRTENIILATGREWDGIHCCFCTALDFYRPQTKLREGNAFTPVCQSFCSGGCAW